MAQFKFTFSRYVKVSQMVNYVFHGVDHKNNLLIPVQRQKLMCYALLRMRPLSIS
jgi:hypothetical protein